LGDQAYQIIFCTIAITFNSIMMFTSKIMSSFWKSLTAATVLSTATLISLTSIALAQEEAPVAPKCTDNSYKCLYAKEVYRLDKIKEGCALQEKQIKGITYQLCRSKGKIVSTSEAITEAGDGIGYWFENGKVVAVRYFHDGTLVTFTGSKVKAIYDDSNSRLEKPTTTARKQFETAAASGYRSIFKVFGVR
jgi:hypothetical protein